MLVPQPPGTSGAIYGSSDDWLANAYNDSRWPWLGTWNGNIKGVKIDNDIDLDQARIDAKINACPANENNKASLEDEAEDKEQEIAKDQEEAEKINTELDRIKQLANI